jgi:hypothetical protein
MPAQTPAAPVINVTNQVNPTPITNEINVEPTPVTVENAINLPPKREVEFVYDNRGQIIGSRPKP